jgi:hypothetical protein
MGVRLQLSNDAKTHPPSPGSQLCLWLQQSTSARSLAFFIILHVFGPCRRGGKIRCGAAEAHRVCRGWRHRLRASQLSSRRSTEGGERLRHAGGSGKTCFLCRVRHAGNDGGGSWRLRRKAVYGTSAGVSQREQWSVPFTATGRAQRSSDLLCSGRHGVDGCWCSQRNEHTRRNDESTHGYKHQRTAETLLGVGA